MSMKQETVTASLSHKPTQGRHRRRARPIDHIEVTHIYHPKTGELLGVLAAKDIPADPSKLVAFARRRAKSGRLPTEAIVAPSGNPDGWDELRSQGFWSNVLEHRFWDDRRLECERLPYRMSADMNGVHDPWRPNPTDLLECQLWRDSLTTLAWRAIGKLREFGLQTSSDPMESWLDLLKANSKLAMTGIISAFDENGLAIIQDTRCVDCIRTASMGLLSALATQAVRNELATRPVRSLSSSATSQRDQDGGANDHALVRSARKRGPRRDQRRWDAIRSEMGKHGESWREHLSEILRELDANQVSLGNFHGMSIDLGEGEKCAAWKWGDLDLAQGQDRERIIDTLRKYRN